MKLGYKFDIIEDKKLKNAFIDFFKQTEVNKSALDRINPYISVYKNIHLEDLKWETLCDIVTLIDSGWMSSKFGLLNFKFIKFLIDNELYKDFNVDILKNLVDELLSMQASKAKRLAIFNKDVNLQSFIICKRNLKSRNCNILIDTKINNKFIVNLLHDFYNSDLFSNGRADINFAIKFSESYDDFYEFNNISDFNYSVFKKQYNFYKDNDSELKLLIKFYIYLYVSSEYTELFKSSDPIDMIWMQQSNFLNYYKQGFKLVDINPFDPVPDGDKWIVRPNGYDKYSTLLKFSSYKKVSFSQLEYKPYLDYVKAFFWKYDCNLVSKRYHVGHIINFLNFIYNYKNNHINKLSNGIDYKSITTKEVYSYWNFISVSVTNACTLNNIIYPVKAFLNMCVENNYLDIESGAFEYLRNTQPQLANGGSDIPEKDLKALEERLRELSETNITYNLYYIIFHLAIETEFRISQLLSLTVSSIKEGMKKNQFFIHSINKTSNSEEVLQPISQYAKRHLDTAIRHTESLRHEAIKDYEDYIFLTQSKGINSKDIKPIERETFHYFLKKQCRELNIKEYTSANLRDTHMTKAIEYAFKADLNPLQTSVLTNHIKRATTNNHYVNHQIKTFAEMTYGVQIGDVDIQGNIIANDNSTFTKEETVDDGCGFCKEDECYILSELGCPMCKGFVVTLDRIPFYELKIKNIDKLIKKEEIKHEREHLHTIKRLYVAYLTRLLELKDNLYKIEKEDRNK